MIQLTESDVQRLLAPPQGMDKVITLLEQSFFSWASGTALNEPRRRVRIPRGAVLHMMGAADIHTGYMGAKIYSSSKDGATFFVLLFDSDTGKPLAQIEADYLGQMRTGAATGLATQYMAREDAGVLGVIGAGGQAWTQVLAISRVRTLRDVRVYCRTAERREAFASRVNRELGLNARAVASGQEAVAGADIVVTATTSSQPVLLGEWLDKGLHVNAIGGNAANRRELDDAAVSRVARIVVDSLEQSRLESGELIAVPRWQEAIELSQVVAGKRPGRASTSEITLFKSNGIALEDVAVAGWLYQQAVLA